MIYMILNAWEARFIQGMRDDGKYYNAKGLMLGSVESVDYLRIEVDSCVLIDDFIAVSRGVRENLKVGDTVIIYEYIPKQLYLLLAVLEGNQSSSNAMAGVDELAVNIGTQVEELKNETIRLAKENKELKDKLEGLVIENEGIKERLDKIENPAEEGGDENA